MRDTDQLKEVESKEQRDNSIEDMRASDIVVNTRGGYTKG